MSPLPEQAATDHRFERDATTLARLWLLGDLRSPSTRRRIDAVLRAAAQRAEHRTAPMSAALHELADALARPGAQDLRPGRDDRIATVRAAGLPRAERLLDVAQAHRHLHRPHRAKALLTALVQPLEAEPDRRPSLERFWASLVACQLSGACGDFETALRLGLIARRQARALRTRALAVKAANALAYIFLSVGDIDAAVSVMTGWDDLAPGQAAPADAVHYNHLLALALSGQIETAWQHLVRHPGLLRPEALFGDAVMRCLAAYILACRGDVAGALPLLQAAEAARPPVQPSPPTAVANRAWLSAEVYLRAGQPARARALVTAALAQADRESWVLSPMNRTQLLRGLALAADAEGDMATALDALKRSQDACFHWVVDSVRCRLQVLHLGARRPADAGALQRRLDAVSRASGQAVGSSRLLARMAHEMRNPLHGVISMTSLLALSELDERQRRHLSVAQSSAQMLLALCNDVLDLARIESGQFRLSPAPTALRPLLRGLVEVYRAQVDPSHVRLSAWIAPDVPPVLQLDPTRLQQVVMNLFANAVRVTSAGHVRVRARWLADRDAGRGGRLRVEVVDRGPGLTAERQATLFREFNDGPAASGGAATGNGLGLAICRGLVDLMGGCIGVDSQVGKGSSFWFELPAKGGQEPSCGRSVTEERGI